MTIEKLRRPARDAGGEDEPVPDRETATPGGGVLRASPDFHPMLSLVDQAITGICAVDHELRVAGFNGAFARMMERRYRCELRPGISLPDSMARVPDDATVAARLLMRAVGGESLRTVQEFGRPRRTYELRLHPVRDADGATVGAGILVDAISMRARGQHNDRFLLDLEGELRALGAGVDVRRVAARRLAEFLAVDRCAYAIVESDEDHCEVDQDYARPGFGSVVGRYRLRDFGAAVGESLRKGRSFVIDDVGSDSRLGRRTRDAYREYGIGALICVPLRRAGRLVAAMAVHHAQPRRWRRDEIALVHAVSHRCWESLERARAESERRAGDARFRALVEGAAEIVWSTDPSGRVVEPLPSWCSFTGQTMAQALGEGWLEAVHPDDRERFRRLWRQAVASAWPFEGEFRFQYAPGGWRWMHARGHAVIADGGAVREWIGMNVDVSERKRIERRDAFLVRLDDAVRSLSDPEEVASSAIRLLGEHLHAQRVTYFEVDPDEHVLTVVRDHAPGLPALSGRTFGLDEFGSGADEALRSGRGFVALESGVAEGSDLVGGPLPSESDTRRSAVLVVPLFRSRRLAAVVGLVRLTPRQWQEEEIDLARAVIHRAWESIERARMARDLRVADERKDEFIAMLAHELRNPLAPLRNGLQVLRRGQGAMPPERIHQMMERQVDQLVRLVDDLLDVSRITRGKMELRMEPQSLSRVLTVAIETARPLIEGARHRLEVDLPASEIHVRGDAVRLAQIFANLLNNAARYTDEGGTIVLRARREGRRAIVSVRDSGIGLAPEMCERVFETFQQVSRGPNDLNSGLGIGLSLARRLTLMHEGRISAHSEGLGRGSEFVVSLPLMTPPEEIPSERAVELGPAIDGVGAERCAGLRILVVDDNQDAADAFGALLKVLGAQVRVCYRASEALGELEREMPEIAFLDLGMPDVNGYELARRIRQHPRGQHLRLIALTGWGQESDRQRSREAGFDHHLVKPVNLEVVESILSSPAPFRPG